MILERRSFVRVRLEIPASLCLYQVDIRHTGSIVDLSLGGCFFPIIGKLQVGQKCQIKLTTGEGLTVQQLEVAGVIVRKNNVGVGIQFLDMLPEQQQVLQKILIGQVL